MDKGKATSAKHHERGRTRSVKARSRSSIVKSQPAEPMLTRHAESAKPVTPKSNGNGTEGHGSPSLIIHDIEKDGLKSLARVLEQLQSDSGATLLLAHHLSPEYQQQLTELLSADSKRKAAEVAHNIQTELATSEEALKRRTVEVGRLSDELTNILGAIQEPIIIVGHDLSIKRCSPSAGQMLNVSQGDIGRKVTGISLGEQIPNLQTTISKVVASSSVEQQEFVDELGRGWLLSVYPYTTSDGRVDGAMLAFKNIDAEKQNEVLLRIYQMKEQRYHDVVHGILMIVDVEGCVMMMNRAGCELLGLDEAAIIGKKWIDEFVPKSHWIVARTIFDQLVDGELDEEFEYPVVTKDGEQRVISWRTALLKDQAGSVTGMICSGEDLTLLRQINTALHKSEERIHLMMESVREDEFFIMDTEGYIVSWISRPEEGKNYRAQEMVGQHFSRLYCPDDFQSGKPMRILETAEVEGRFEEDGWRVRKDGTRMRAYVIIIPIRDEARNLLGFSNVTRYLREKTEPKGALSPGFAIPIEFGER